jgi:hypothetical protein
MGPLRQPVLFLRRIRAKPYDTTYVSIVMHDEPSATYRLRALASEQQAHDATDPAIKREWVELAGEWHRLANIAAEASGQKPDIDFA